MEWGGERNAGQAGGARVRRRLGVLGWAGWLLLLVAAPAAARQAGAEDGGAAGGVTPEAVERVAEEAARDVAAAVAGYDRGFYIRDGEGRSELRIGFLSQVRAVQSHRGEGAVPGSDEAITVGGYQLRRFQINLQGYFLGPRFTYRLRLDASNAGGVSAAWAWLGYQLSPVVDIRVGQNKPSFLHEEDVGAGNQLAVERSYTADYFTTKFAQGVQVNVRRNRLRFTGMLHNGSYGWRTDLDNESARIGVSGRAEYLIGSTPSAGWSRYSDFSSWSGAAPVVIVGAAADYERGRNQGGVYRPDITKWTGDVTAKFGAVALFGAIIGQRFGVDPDAADLPDGLDGASQLGLVAQTGVFLVPNRLEVFGRYESIDFDGVYFRVNQGSVQGGSGPVAEDRLTALTLGGNYYFAGHNAKLTADAVVVGDPVPVANNGQGLLRSTGSGKQLALRTQLQLSF